MRSTHILSTVLGASIVVAAFATLSAQTPSAPPKEPAGTAPPLATLQPGASTPVPAATIAAAVASAVTPPADYLIGPDDVLSIFFWRDKDLSSDVTVRPDGKISLPVINELQAVGLTPEQLRTTVIKAATHLFSEEPTVTVIVKQINSRKVFITGSIAKSGPYPLMEPTTVLQLISKAGGLTEFADRKHIRVVRAEARPDGVPWSFEVNYNDLVKGVNLQKNVLLKPGDTVIVK